MFKVIEDYQPKLEQEKVDKKLMLDFIKTNNNTLSRENLAAHFTASAIVVNDKLNKVLFIHHNIYNSWAWVGGHNDNDPDFLNVALKEAKEETGLTNIKPVVTKPIMLDVLNVNNHIKNGKYVPDHLHLNLCYLLVADEFEQTKIKVDENSGVRWFLIEEVLNYVSEEKMKKVYQKAFDYIKENYTNDL